MKTEATTLKQQLQVWAIPQSAYHIEEYPDEPPFYYEVRQSQSWSTGAVLVMEQEFEMTIPAGIDLTEKAIETLGKAAEEVQRDADANIESINSMISKLLMLEHKPDLQAVE